MASWGYYNDTLASFEKEELLRRPVIPAHCSHNAHMYYVLLAESVDRQKVLSDLKQSNIFSVFHYVPLHSSPAGQKYGRVHGSMNVTDTKSERLIRLPLWVGLTPAQQDKVIETLYKSMK